MVLLHHHQVSHQHQRENGQRGMQAAAVQNHNQTLNEVPSTIKNTKQRKLEVEAECLSPVLHHQLLHARAGWAE